LPDFKFEDKEKFFVWLYPKVYIKEFLEGMDKLQKATEFLDKAKALRVKIALGKTDMDDLIRMRDGLRDTTAFYGDVGRASKRMSQEQKAAITSFTAMSRALEKNSIESKKYIEFMQDMLDFESEAGAKRRDFMAKQLGKSSKEMEEMIYSEPAKVSLELMRSVQKTLIQNINFQKMTNIEIQKQIGINEKIVEQQTGITMDKQEALKLAKMTDKELEKHYAKELKQTKMIFKYYDDQETAFGSHKKLIKSIGFAIGVYVLKKTGMWEKGLEHIKALLGKIWQGAINIPDVGGDIERVGGHVKKYAGWAKKGMEIVTKSKIAWLMAISPIGQAAMAIGAAAVAVNAMYRDMEIGRAHV